MTIDNNAKINKLRAMTGFSIEEICRHLGIPFQPQSIGELRDAWCAGENTTISPTEKRRRRRLWGRLSSAELEQTKKVLRSFKNDPGQQIAVLRTFLSNSPPKSREEAEGERLLCIRLDKVLNKAEEHDKILAVYKEAPLGSKTRKRALGKFLRYCRHPLDITLRNGEFSEPWARRKANARWVQLSNRAIRGANSLTDLGKIYPHLSQKAAGTCRRKGKQLLTDALKYLDYASDIRQLCEDAAWLPDNMTAAAYRKWALTSIGELAGATDLPAAQHAASNIPPGYENLRRSAILVLTRFLP